MSVHVPSCITRTGPDAISDVCDPSGFAYVNVVSVVNPDTSTRCPVARAVIDALTRSGRVESSAGAVEVVAVATTGGRGASQPGITREAGTTAAPTPYTGSTAKTPLRD